MNLVTASLIFGWSCSFILLTTSCIVIYIFLKTEGVE
jgi:hypothetical protein